MIALSLYIFADCVFGDKGIQALIAALASNSTLRRFAILGRDGDAHAPTKGWQLRDGNARALAKVLETDSKLLRLDLWNNRIGYREAQVLAEALKRNETLQRVGLGRNQIGDMGAQALAKALESNATLQHLDVSWNQIGNEGGKALAKVLESNTTLLYLAIDFNSIGDAADKSIKFLTKRNESLEKLCDGRNLLERTKDVSIALHSAQMPIYVLLEIVEMELALQMATIELDCVGKRFITIEQHRRRCETLQRGRRLEILQFAQGY